MQKVVFLGHFAKFRQLEGHFVTCTALFFIYPRGHFHSNFSNIATTAANAQPHCSIIMCHNPVVPVFCSSRCTPSALSDCIKLAINSSPAKNVNSKTVR